MVVYLKGWFVYMYECIVMINVYVCILEILKEVSKLCYWF